MDWLVREAFYLWVGACWSMLWPQVKCRGVWLHQFWGSVWCLFGSGHWISQHWYVWSLVSDAGCFQWLQGLSESSVASLGSMARYQSRQQWWPELVVCTHLATGASYRGQWSGRAGCRRTCICGTTSQAAKLEPTMGTLVVAGPLVVDVYYCDCSVSPWARRSGDWWQGQSWGVQGHSWQV